MKCTSVMLKTDSFLSFPWYVPVCMKKSARRVCVRMRAPGCKEVLFIRTKQERFEWSTNIPFAISVNFAARMDPIEIFYDYFTFIRVSWEIFMHQFCCVIVQRIVFATFNIQYFISTTTSALWYFWAWLGATLWLKVTQGATGATGATLQF